MKPIDINTSLIESYFALLKGLSPNNKMELIAMLSDSLNSKVQEKDDSWKLLFGALEIDQSADDFILELKKDRKFNRKSIQL